MTRIEILEKNWKEFRLSTGLKYEPMSDKAYEFMENAMEQYAELRLGDVVGQSEVSALYKKANINKHQNVCILNNFAYICLHN
jgi:hypothetical protein